MLRKRIQQVMMTALIPTVSAATTPPAPAGGGGMKVTPIIPSQPDGTFGSIEEIVKKLFDIATGVAGAIFLLIFLYGAIQYLTGAAQEEQLVKAKKIMLNAAVGLLLVAGAWTIAKFLGGELGAAGF